MIRSIWVILNGVICTLVLSTAVVVVTLVRHRGDMYEKIARTWARWILWASGARVEIEGIENIPTDQPAIIASNHQSWFDVFALAAILPRRYRFIAKEELRKIPLFGLAWVSAGHISINRQDRNKAITALDAAARLVRTDNSLVVIFPEGTRSPTGELLPFKKGAFMLALRTGIAIVPTAVIGSRAVQKKGDWRVSSGPVIVRFGPAVDSSKFDEDHREQLMLAVRERVAAMLNHPERIRDR